MTTTPTTPPAPDDLNPASAGLRPLSDAPGTYVVETCKAAGVRAFA